jgi:CARDB protein
VFSRFFSTAQRGGRGAILSIALASSLILGAMAQVSPAEADEVASVAPAFDDKLDPDARLQIVINSIKILDDRDWGEGDMFFKLFLWRVKPGCADNSTSEECTTGLLASAPMEFGANDGDVVTLNRAIPDPPPGAQILDSSISPDAGIPVFADQRYGLALMGTEQDPVIDDDMGTLLLSLTADNKWSIGPAVATPSKSVSDPTRCFPIPYDCSFEATSPGSFVADYSVNYEIRRMPLPDLVPSIRQINGDNGQVFYCGRVANLGERASAAFQLAVRADLSLVKVMDFPGLDAEASTERCILRSELPSGQFMLSFRADEARQIAEMDEHNNLYQWRIPALVSAPVLQPIAAEQPNLVVNAIRLNDAESTSQRACSTGKNAIGVALKNSGTGATEPTVLRLQVDSDNSGAIERPVASLDAGKSIDVTFEDVSLKKGAHTLTATIDAKKTITESKEDDNSLAVNVKCKDDGD